MGEETVLLAPQRKRLDYKVIYLVLFNFISLAILVALATEILFQARYQAPRGLFQNEKVPRAIEEIAHQLAGGLVSVAAVIVIGIGIVNTVILTNGITRLWTMLQGTNLGEHIRDGVFYGIWSIGSYLLSLITGINLQGRTFDIRPFRAINAYISTMMVTELCTVFIAAFITGCIFSPAVRRLRSWLFPLRAILIAFGPPLLAIIYLKIIALLCHPLPSDDTLATTLTKLAVANNFPPGHIVTANSTTFIGHESAFTISSVLDTLIVLPASQLDLFTTPQWLAIVAHELGHWSKRDGLSSVAIKIVGDLLWLPMDLWIWFAPSVYAAFQMPGEPLIVGLILSNLFQSLFYQSFSMIKLAVGRAFEYRADQFAARLGLRIDLARALLVLHMEQSQPFSSSLPFQWMFLTHPSADRRIVHLINSDETL